MSLDLVFVLKKVKTDQYIPSKVDKVNKNLWVRTPLGQPVQM